MGKAEFFRNINIDVSGSVLGTGLGAEEQSGSSPEWLEQANPSVGLHPSSWGWRTGAACWQDSASNDGNGECKEIPEISQWVCN